VQRSLQVLTISPAESSFPHAQSIVRSTTTYWGKGKQKLKDNDSGSLDGVKDQTG